VVAKQGVETPVQGFICPVQTSLCDNVLVRLLRRQLKQVEVEGGNNLMNQIESVSDESYPGGEDVRNAETSPLESPTTPSGLAV
jgi:hypothetical protein